MTPSAFRLAVAFVCVAVSLLGPGGASSGGTRTLSAEKRGGTLRVVVSSDFGSIEPALVSSFDGLQIMNVTQLGLVSFRHGRADAGRRILPMGAGAMPSISRDGRTYVFRIRRGLRFSDGAPVTARNFVAGFERVLDPRVRATRAFLFADVKGARAFMSGKAAHVSGLIARNDRLVIVLTRPAPDFLERLALPIVSAMPLNLPVVPGGVDAPLPSAGPYYVKEYQRGRLARLVRNVYWNRSAVPSVPAHVDEIEYLGRAPDEAAAAVSRGEADVVTFIGGSLAPGLVRDLTNRYGVNRRRFFVRPRLGRAQVIFNFRRPLIQSQKFRRAVNVALDRRQLARAHGPLAGQPTDQLVLPGRAGFRDWKLYRYEPNIVAARRLAREALRQRVVSLYVPSTPWGPTVGAVIKSNLARVGVRVRVETVATPVFVSRLALAAEPWDLAVWVWATFRVDPSAFINFPLERRNPGAPVTPGFNLGRFDNSEWDARMRRVARMRRGRENAFALLDRDLMRTPAPLAPYLVENALTLVSARVGCFSSLNNGWPNLAALCLD